MSTFTLRLILFLLLTGGLFSCEKQEKPITLPPKNDSSFYAQADLGENYDQVVYFSLESQSIVKSVQLTSWDLAFQSGTNDHFVFLNGGNNMVLYHTGKYALSEVSSANINTNQALIINDSTWSCDDPGGQGSLSAVGEWAGGKRGAATGEVYAVLVGTKIYKFRLVSYSTYNYVIEFAPLEATTGQQVDLPKNPNCNFSYFSFSATDHIVYPEPDKSTWDLVLTRFLYVYRDLNNFRYIVTGALLNPYQTSGAADSTTGFSKINENTIPLNQFVTRRDVVGFDWKSYDYTNQNARYVTNQMKCYVISTQSGQLWKLHFLDYYSLGHKGSPSMEYLRLR